MLADMDFASHISIFTLGTFAIWMIVSIRARYQLVTAGAGGLHLTAAYYMVLWLLTVPSVLVVGALKAVDHLRKAFRPLVIFRQSPCKATVRACTRKSFRLRYRHISAPPTHRNGPESPGFTGQTSCIRRIPSSLLRIPAELRAMMIKRSVMHYDVLDCRPTILLRPRKQFGDAMAFIRTCRQIYQEGHPIVFGCALFHIWTRQPFYRQLQSMDWEEFTMIHLAAQLNRQRTSRLGATIRDLDRMSGLRDIYMSIWDFVDFEINRNAVAGVFGPLRLRLKSLSLVQINLICPKATNVRAEKRLKTLLVAAKGNWPVGSEFGVLRSLQCRITKWRAFLQVQNYKPKRAIGMDGDLVALPWDGEAV